jgi:hypothetical protein
MLLGIFGWIACGVALGFNFSKLINLHGDDPRIGIGMSAVAGGIGGLLYSLISRSAIVGFNLWSLIFAAASATVVLTIWHVIRSRATYDRPSVRRSY